MIKNLDLVKVIAESSSSCASMERKRDIHEATKYCRKCTAAMEELIGTTEDGIYDITDLYVMQVIYNRCASREDGCLIMNKYAQAIIDGDKETQLEIERHFFIKREDHSEEEYYAAEPGMPIALE